MGKIVNCWDEWTTLRRVVVGDPTGATIPAPEPAWMHNLADGGVPLGYWGAFPQDHIDAAREQQNGFIKIMEKRGVIVDRVQVHPAWKNNRSVTTPDWTQINLYTVNNPRDLFLPLGNEIMEAPGSRRSRFFEYLCMRPLFEKWFKEDPDFMWTAAPRPQLSDESYVPGYYWDYTYSWDDATRREKMLKWEYHLTEKEPLWDAADACRAGKDIFWQCSSVTNRGGMEWLRRYLGSRGFRLHPIQFDSSACGYWRPWHIDVILTILHPGTAILCAQKEIMNPEVVDLFKKNDWEIIRAVLPDYPWQEKLTLLGNPFGTGMCVRNWVSMNTFSLGPKEICVFEKEKPYIDQLDKLGMEVIPVSYDKVYRFGGMLHCNTLDVNREGGCEDYFPKQ